MKDYREIENRYLAQGLAFLGFRYFKEGYDKDTVYKFEDTKELHETIGKLLTIKRELGN